ncbi:Mitochondrial distribution and morphology protein 12 [Bachmanniomyces sp. S44760]|nr:Mitochondrial distribution and morphology protein 12 [Bachmanniomyces sp. S44760]
MSIDIDWENLTSGPDGLALAQSIREFIHDKFQQVELPRFIRSVEVHSFDFGDECPVVELKDVCDPLPDFYDKDEDENSESDGEEVEDAGYAGGYSGSPFAADGMRSGQQKDSQRSFRGPNPNRPTSRPPPVDTQRIGLPSYPTFAGHTAGSMLSRSSTPGIPGGTSNMSYFHLPLSAGLSGSQTPLAAVAGGTPYSAGWQDHHYPPPWGAMALNSHSHDLHSSVYHHRVNNSSGHIHDPSQSPHSDLSTRPSTSDSHAHPDSNFTADEHNSSLEGSNEPESPHCRHDPSPNDAQIVLRISYTGSVRLSLTASILLDYPMPSFVGIPLKLNITGLSFDGVALLAYLRKRAHFCFLGEDDAEALLGADNSNQLNENNKRAGERQEGTQDGDRKKGQKGDDKLGGLLREIRVESEIGQKEGGKQVLKNVGKVEKFVLDQVRRIFEDEFVYPSFWTFLL